MRLAPDIAVISEAERSISDVFPKDVNCLRIGDHPTFGLAVISFNGWRIEAVDHIPVEKIFLPVRIKKEGISFNLLAVCVKKAENYTQPTLRALTGLRGFLKGGPAVIAGDFNQSASFDPRRSQNAQFGSVAAKMRELEMRSVWHSFHSEEFATESEATYYHRWQRSLPSHIDYIFTSDHFELNAVRLGSYSHYVKPGLSDHVPLTADISINCTRLQLDRDRDDGRER